MNNDPKLLYLIFQTDELIKAQEKAEETKSHMHIVAYRKKRREIKIWIAGNKIIAPTAPAVRQEKFKNHSSFSHLAR